MKTPVLSAIALLSYGSLANATIVFSDDFSDPDGTAIGGKSSDVGQGWTQTLGGGISVQGGAIDTTGGARLIFGSFSSNPLSAGQRLTLTYVNETLGNFFSGGFAGVSLYSGGSGGTEQIFTGDTGGSTFWGVAGGGSGGTQLSADNTVGTTATFEYVFDTGSWTFATTSGVNLTGTGTAGLALDTFRLANNNGGDIKISNVTVDVVPEPSSTSLLAGLGALALLRRRRR